MPSLEREKKTYRFGAILYIYSDSIRKCGGKKVYLRLKFNILILNDQAGCQEVIHRMLLHENSKSSIVANSHLHCYKMSRQNISVTADDKMWWCVQGSP